MTVNMLVMKAALHTISAKITVGLKYAKGESLAVDKARGESVGRG